MKSEADPSRRVGAPFEQTVNAACPACGRGGVLLATIEIDIPYFGRAVQTVLRCEGCGFRHADFLILDQREPVRSTIAIAPETMEARVVRSSSGTWRIPELGFLAEPSAASESFVTNVEGMLDRARDIVLRARRIMDDDPAKIEVADRLLERIARIVAGEERATLIVEDPWGNSMIAHPDATRETLTPEEAEALATGMIVFHKDDFR